MATKFRCFGVSTKSGGSPAGMTFTGPLLLPETLSISKRFDDDNKPLEGQSLAISIPVFFLSTYKYSATVCQ